MARPQEFSGKVIPISRSNSNVDVVKKIIDLAKSRNINDKPRIVALLTIAQAESGLNPKAAEKFTYNPQRARAVFGTRLKNYTDQQLINLIGLDKNGRYKDQKKLGDILYSKPGSGSNDNGGNLPNEGYKFRGRGITQITFRGNYEAMMKNLQKQGFSSLDIINNPDLATSTDENSINIFIAGKLEGQFGRKLVEGPDYLNDTRWILATQMGKSKSKSTNPDEWTINSEAFEVYSKARQSIIGTKWIMDLIESAGISGESNIKDPQIVVAENTKVKFKDKNNNETEISVVSHNFENIPEYKVSVNNNSIQPLIGRKIGDKVILSIPFGSLQQIFPTGINSEVEIISIETINLLNPENNQLEDDISQDQNSSSDNNTNNNTNSIEGQLRRLTQFFEPIIKPSIIQQEITPNTGEKETYEKGVGFTPFVWYNGAHMSNIENLVLYHNGILPSVRITLKDTWGLLSEDGFPVDDTIITVFINSRSKILRSIFMDFKIVKFQMMEDQNTYEITGVINIPNLYLRSFKSYKSSTSHEALQQLSKDLNIGFCSNIDNTDDKMTWINPGYKNHEYINNVVLNSYHSDEGFLSAYIDFYYNLCYVELEKELNRDISNDKMINSTGKSALTQGENDMDEESLIPLLLTNDKGVRDTSAYFESFEVDNRSTQISLQKAYRMKTKFYDSNKKEFLVFDVDSITSQGDRTIIMKSRPGDEDYFRNNFATIWTGKIDTGEEGVGNTHPNFNYSIVQNRQNIDDLYKISCKIVMSTPNLNLYKYQKIQIIFSRSAQTISQPSAFTKRLSGDWLITDIEIVYDGRRITQNISLIKRELSLDDNEIINSEKGYNQNKSSESTEESINENPLPPEDASELQEPTIVVENDNIIKIKDTESNSELEISPTEERDTSILTSTEISNNNQSNITLNSSNIKSISSKNIIVGDKIIQSIIANTVNGSSIELTNSYQENKIQKWPYTVKGSKTPIKIYDDKGLSRYQPNPVSHNTKINLNSYIKNEYIPIINSLNVSKGTKLLAIIITHKEGFNQNSISYKTNNPGNIGNTDEGPNKIISSLREGINLQIDYLNKVSNGNKSSYRLGEKVDIKPLYSTEIAKNRETYKISPFLIGYEFNYDGKIEQFVKIYSKSARNDNNYISTIVSWFRKNGYTWVNEETTIKELLNINDSNPIIT